MSWSYRSSSTAVLNALDSILFGPGITFNDLVFSRSVNSSGLSSNMYISLKGSEAPAFIISLTPDTRESTIENIKFFDNSVYNIPNPLVSSLPIIALNNTITPDVAQNNYVFYEGTSNNDTITAQNAAQFDGGLGDDTFIGSLFKSLDQFDTFFETKGSGNDTIIEQNSTLNNTVNLGNMLSTAIQMFQDEINLKLFWSNGVGGIDNLNIVNEKVNQNIKTFVFSDGTFSYDQLITKLNTK